MKKIAIVLALILIALIAFSGCTQQKTNPKNNSADENQLNPIDQNQFQQIDQNKTDQNISENQKPKIPWLFVQVPATAKKGDNIDANIWIFDANDLTEFEIVLGTDSNNARVSIIQQGNFLNSDGNETIQINEKIEGGWILNVKRSNKTGLSGNGILAKASIQAVFPGIVEVQFKKSDLINSEHEYSSHYAKAGIIIISG